MSICPSGGKNIGSVQSGLTTGVEPMPIQVAAEIGSPVCMNSRPVIRTNQGASDTIHVQLTDRSGEPVSLPSDTSLYDVVFQAEDRSISTQLVIDKVGIVDDTTTATVSFLLTPHDTRFAGIMSAQIGVFSKATKAPLFVQDYWLEVAYGLSSNATTGPITISEIRMALRDVCPDQNFLLDDVEFKDAEIAYAIRRPIDQFNETNKPTTHYSTSNFPFRFNWTNATIGYLMRQAAYSYARNYVPASAGDVAIDDKNKYGIYLTMSKELLDEWQSFIRAKKVELNVEGSYRSQRSSYSRFGRI